MKTPRVQRSLPPSFNDSVGSRGKERRQAKARAKMDRRHGVVRIDPEIEKPKP